MQVIAAGKDQVLTELVSLAGPAVSAQADLLGELRAREAAFPTALGDGVAMPHVRTDHVSEVCVAAAVMRDPIPFGAADGNPVDVFFLVLSPKSAPSEHLRVLRALSRLVANHDTVLALREASSVAAFLNIVGSVATI